MVPHALTSLIVASLHSKLHGPTSLLSPKGGVTTICPHVCVAFEYRVSFTLSPGPWTGMRLPKKRRRSTPHLLLLLQLAAPAPAGEERFTCM